MTRDAAIVRCDELVELAQSGHAPEALRAAQLEIGADESRAHPALLFAGAVAHDVLGQHEEAAAWAGRGVRAAERSGSPSWLASCLGMRALQGLRSGKADLAGRDESEVMRDLARAQVVLSAESPESEEWLSTLCNLATAYVRLRLYELAVPLLEQMSLVLGAAGSQLPPEARVIQQLNLATLHLVWALELWGIEADGEALEHCAQARHHAEWAQRAAGGPHEHVWAERAMVFAGCAQAHVGADTAAAVSAVETSLDVLAPVGADYERALSAPVLALALAAEQRIDEGIRLLDGALAALTPSTDPVVRAANQYARLRLCSPVSEGAQAGLAFGKTLSEELWRQRARRLSAAEAIMRNERLEAELERVSRDSDLDPLTGTASRRAFNRRVSALDGDSAAGEVGVGVLVIDLDRLKRVNDVLGHQAGDVVLHEVGHALSSCLRGNDMVSRFGGDEFVALVHSSADGGQAVARRMLDAVRGIAWTMSLLAAPTISIGVSFTTADRRLSDALADADRAMYLAKRSGGDRIEVYGAGPDRLDAARGHTLIQPEPPKAS